MECRGSADTQVCLGSAGVSGGSAGTQVCWGSVGVSVCAGVCRCVVLGELVFVFSLFNKYICEKEVLL